jgi:hypothetical protein
VLKKKKIAVLWNLVLCSLAEGTNVSVEGAPSEFRLEEIFYSEEGGNKFQQNIGTFLSDYTMSHPKDSNLYI